MTGHSWRGSSALALVVVAGLAVADGSEEPFTNEAILRGLNYSVGTGNALQLGAGVGLFDIDGDGDPDAVVLGSTDGRVGLFENDGTGHFLDRTYDNDFIPLIPSQSLISGLSAADVDGDGDVDIHITRYGQADRLYRNNGGWSFSDITQAAGVADAGFGLGATWADFDGDTRLDAYLSVRTATNANFGENALFQNRGLNTFIDVCPILQVQATGEPTLVSAWVDFDLDGDDDLYVGNDKGQNSPLHNRLYENTGGAFTEITDAANARADVDCMGIAFGDVDSNGWPDFYVTNIPEGNRMLLNNGDKTFTVAQGTGTEVYVVSWGTTFFDYNNDTLLDLYVCNQSVPNSLFRNDGQFPMTSVGQELGVAGTVSSYCVATADVDGDGDLDILNTELGRPARLYINHEGQKRRWAQFDVVGTGANRLAIGANVFVDTPGAPVTQYRQVRAGTNYKSQEPSTVHFGLDNANTMSSVRVTWPNNAASRELTNYKANFRWTVYPPELLGDADLSRTLEHDDYAALEAALADGPFGVVPGSEQLDMDGDALIDEADLALLAARLRCNAADVAPFFGVLNANDVIDFVTGFAQGDPAGDVFPDGLFNANDVIDFVSAFNAGCP